MENQNKNIRKDKAGNTLKLRQGRFSQAEIDYMRMNGASMPVAAIAAHLNREAPTVGKWLTKNGIKSDTFYDTDPAHSRIKAELLTESFWLQTKEQFSEQEQHYFICQYCEHINQLQKISTVEYTEKMQVMHLIRNEVLLDRILMAQKRAYEEEQEVKAAIKKLDPKKSSDEIRRLRGAVSQLFDLFSTYSKEAKALQEQINKLRESLNAERKQRVKDIREVAKDFTKLVASLQNSKFKEEEGKEINVFRAAMEIERKKLSEWHEYADGNEDIPLLTPELIDRLKPKNV